MPLNPKWPPVNPKMADGVIGHFESLSLNKFFDPSTPSIRKGDNGETKKNGGEKTFLVATNVVTSRPPE